MEQGGAGVLVGFDGEPVTRTDPEDWPSGVTPLPDGRVVRHEDGELIVVDITEGTSTSVPLSNDVELNHPVLVGPSTLAAVDDADALILRVLDLETGNLTSQPLPCQAALDSTHGHRPLTVDEGGLATFYGTRGGQPCDGSAASLITTGATLGLDQHFVLPATIDGTTLTLQSDNYPLGVSENCPVPIADGIAVVSAGPLLIGIQL